MATKLTMPTLGGMMEEGTIIKWYKQEGEAVSEGEPILQIMSDKANMEIESPATGTLLKVVAWEGKVVPIKDLIAIIGDPNESLEDAPPAPKPAPAPAKTPVPAPVAAAPVPSVAPVTATAPKGRVIASPKAKKLVADYGMEIAVFAGRGTGPEGRVTEADVLAYIAQTRQSGGPAPLMGMSGTKVEDLSREQLLAFYETMVRIRFFEQAVHDLSQQGLLGGAAHLSVGQEAVAVGACFAIEPPDYITSTHRGHGHCIAKGGDVPKMMAEVVGKVDGYCRGKGGSMHIADFNIGICGANGIVGGGLPISAGLGLSSGIKSDGKVTLCFFGDGAANQGSFHESVNLAALWKLPVVFICENNQYAMTTPFCNACSVPNIALRAAGYGIQGKTIDGNDILEVYREVREAAAHARAGGGPVLIECITYRQSGHYAGDPCPYRTSDELCKWQDENDPIMRFRERLFQTEAATRSDIREIETRARVEIDAAVEFAKASPMPDVEEVAKHVYSAPPARPIPGSYKLPAPGSREITYRDAINEALSQVMERDSRAFLIGEDVGFGAFRVTQGLIDKFGPERVRNTPISEAAIVGSAIGSAAAGLRPIAEIMYIDFTTVAMDQIVNQAAKFHYMSGGSVNLPLVIRTPGGSGGRGNAAQHSQSLEAIFMHVPGLKVVIPSTPYDAKGLLISSIEDPDPVIYIEHKILYNVKAPVPEDYYSIPLGLADVKRQGRDLTIITYSRMLDYSQKAADMLAQQGIEVEIVDLRSLVPLDLETVVNSVRKTHRVMIVEEDCRTAGVGAEIVSLIVEHAFDYLDAEPVRVAGLDVPIPYAPLLEKASVPSPERIAAAAVKLMGK